MNMQNAVDSAAFGLGRVERAMEDIRAGKMVIVSDDEDRESEGDLLIAAAKVGAART